jgi:uncharacterized phage protein (TIGR01671 family)
MCLERLREEKQPMREIKFRAWDKEKKRMALILNLFEKNGVRLIESLTGEHEELAYKNIELMQYTGLKDKDGKEIYEGDILDMIVSKFIPDEDGLDYELIKAQIYFENGSFWFKGNGRTDCNWHFYNEAEREVIGNIYEHPHLLETGGSEISQPV